LLSTNLSWLQGSYSIIKSNMDKNKLYYLFAVILVLSSIAILLLAKRNGLEGQGGYTKQLPILSEESVKKLPPDFLRFLIMGHQANVLSSEVVKSAPYLEKGYVEETVIFTANESISNLLKEYQEYFEGAGWKVLDSNKVSASAGAISATRGSYQAFASFTTEAGNTRVTLREIFPEPKK
jgi:hypothetical protein